MTRDDFTPTTAAPGTDEKIAVMANRLANRLPIHHPGDATFERGGTVGFTRGWLSGKQEVTE